MSSRAGPARLLHPRRVVSCTRLRACSSVGSARQTKHAAQAAVDKIFAEAAAELPGAAVQKPRARGLLSRERAFDPIAAAAGAAATAQPETAPKGRKLVRGVRLSDRSSSQGVQEDGRASIGRSPADPSSAAQSGQPIDLAKLVLLRLPGFLLGGSVEPPARLVKRVELRKDPARPSAKTRGQDMRTPLPHQVENAAVARTPLLETENDGQIVADEELTVAMPAGLPAKMLKTKQNGP